MNHVGIVVDDLAEATEFFVALGLELQGEWSAEGRWVDRIIGLDEVRTDVAFLQTPDGHGQLELIKFRSPSYQGNDGPMPANAPGIRHLAFVVDDIDAVVSGLRAHGVELVGELVRYGDSYRLCYVRGPEGSSSSWRSGSPNELKRAPSGDLIPRLDSDAGEALFMRGRVRPDRRISRAGDEFSPRHMSYLSLNLLAGVEPPPGIQGIGDRDARTSR